jgi:hypothetical protein
MFLSSQTTQDAQTGFTVQAVLGINERTYLKIINAKRTSGVAQVVVSAYQQCGLEFNSQCHQIKKQKIVCSLDMMQ